MTGTVTISLRGQAAQLLNANHRLHWRLKAERTKYWRTLAYLAARENTQRNLGVELARVFTEPTDVRNRITVTFSWPDKRRRDVGNLAPTAKAIVDGLVDAGLLVDDDDRHVLGPDLRRGHGPFGVVITVEPLAGQASS